MVEKKIDILDRAKKLAILIIKMTDRFPKKEAAFSLTKQIVRSATSVAANLKEASSARSKREFQSIIGIALKEANETNLWLEIIEELKYIEDKYIKALIKEVIEISKILATIILHTKK